MADIAEEKGQRSFIGFNNITDCAPPELLQESNDISIEETEKFIQTILYKNVS